MRLTRIADHGLLADGRSAALVDRDGSVDWWCPTRFDGPSVFGRLLDDAAGHWSIRPEGRFDTERAYLTDPLVLRTVFTTATGAVAVTDALALEPGARGHDVGRHSPRVLSPGGAGPLRRGAAPVALPAPLRVRAGDPAPGPAGRRGRGHRGRHAPGPARRRTAVGRDGRGVRLVHRPRGRAPGFTLGYVPTYGVDRPVRLDAGEVVDGTVASWRSWIELHDYRGLYRDQVRHSALVVQGMTYRPSGAVVAAATMGLPEKLGGERNYDYRYVWVRDFSFTLEALWRATCTNEVSQQFQWLARSMGVVENGVVPIMYGVEGERDLSEHRLDHLDGFADSRPVLLGNDAWRQRQTDVLGEALCAAWLMREHLDPMAPEIRQLLRGMTDRAARDWRLPDAGMWEERDVERHHVLSKVQCWTALDRPSASGTGSGRRRRRPAGRRPGTRCGGPS